MDPSTDLGSSFASCTNVALQDLTPNFQTPNFHANYRKALAASDIKVSMSRKGNCWDNAVAESFFATIKKELIHRSHYKTRREAAASIFEYIEVFYNRVRKHPKLGYISPVQFRSNNLPAATAA